MRKLTGKTYTGGACGLNTRLKRTNSVAIVEDDGDFLGVETATHELAHLLGKFHASITEG